LYQIIGVIFFKISKSVAFILEEQNYPNFVVKNGKSNPIKKHCSNYDTLHWPLDTIRNHSMSEPAPTMVPLPFMKFLIMQIISFEKKSTLKKIIFYAKMGKVL
jgi:hypothetical protein